MLSSSSSEEFHVMLEAVVGNAKVLQQTYNTLCNDEAES